MKTPRNFASGDMLTAVCDGRRSRRARSPQRPLGRCPSRNSIPQRHRRSRASEPPASQALGVGWRTISSRPERPRRTTSTRTGFDVGEACTVVHAPAEVLVKGRGTPNIAPSSLHYRPNRGPGRRRNM